jgi:hypothetical protein
MESEKINCEDLAYHLDCIDQEIETIFIKIRVMESEFRILEKIANEEGLYSLKE